MNTWTRSATHSRTPRRVASRNADLSPTPPKQIFYFQSDVNLDAVAAVVGASFVLSGTTSCDQLKDILSDQGNETEIFVRNADENITNVLVSVGGAPSVAATPTGPGDTPWTSWTATVSGLARRSGRPSASRRSRAGIRRRPRDPPSSTSRRPA